MAAVIKPPEKRAPFREGPPPPSPSPDISTPIRPAPTRPSSTSSAKFSSPFIDGSSDTPSVPSTTSPKLPPFSMDSLPKVPFSSLPDSDESSRSVRRNTTTAPTRHAPALPPSPKSDVSRRLTPPLPPPPPGEIASIEPRKKNSDAVPAPPDLESTPEMPPPPQEDPSTLMSTPQRKFSEIPPPPDFSPLDTFAPNDSDVPPPPPEAEIQSAKLAPASRRRHVRTYTEEETAVVRIIQVSLPQEASGGHLSFRCSPVSSANDMEAMVVKQLSKRGITSASVSKWLAEFREAWELYLEHGEVETKSASRSGARDAPSLFRWIDGEAPSAVPEVEPPSLPRARSLSTRFLRLVKPPEPSSPAVRSCLSCPWAVLPQKAVFCFNCGIPAINCEDSPPQQQQKASLSPATSRGGEQAQCPSCQSTVAIISNFCYFCGTKILDSVSLVVKLFAELKEQKLWYAGVHQTKGLRGFRLFLSSSGLNGKFAYAQLVAELLKSGKPGILLLNYQHSLRGPADETLVFVSYLPKGCEMEEKQKFLDSLRDIQASFAEEDSSLKAYVTGSSAKEIDEDSLRKCLLALGVKL